MASPMTLLLAMASPKTLLQRMASPWTLLREMSDLTNDPHADPLIYSYELEEYNLFIEQEAAKLFPARKVLQNKKVFRKELREIGQRKRFAVTPVGSRILCSRVSEPTPRREKINASSFVQLKKQGYTGRPIIVDVLSGYLGVGTKS